MTEHLFSLRQGESGVKIRGGPSFGHGPNSTAYRFVAEKDHVETLKNKTNRNGDSIFRWLPGKALDAVLESADEAVDAIESGEYDAVLDLLLFAERERYGNRVSVVEGIDTRAREIQAERVESGDAGADISPTDVAPNTV